MTTVNSTSKPSVRKIKPKKPAKPTKDFPLFPHASGRWAKKIKGKFHYFGPWSDPTGALDQWEAERADLLAGRKPASRRVKDGECTLRDLANKFLTSKKNRVDSGELSPHSFTDYHRVCESLIDAFGKDVFVVDLKPDDFERLRVSWAKRWGPVRLGNEINRAKIVFNFATANDLIEKPVRYGQGFERPSSKTLELARHAKGKRLFTAKELRNIIAAARQPLKAMFLLGINCGLGNSDVVRMKMAAIDLDSGWLDYPRAKTGVGRRCWLWPETVQALREWGEARPQPLVKADADLVFLTSPGGSWYRETSDNPVSRESRILLDALGIKGNRNFYALRHTFETVAGGTIDQVAVNHVMGHKDNSMAGRYREEIDNARLQAVAQHVRAWLFGTEAEGGAA